eukprot:758851-Hanusia_phi.AAC.1
MGKVGKSGQRLADDKIGPVTLSATLKTGDTLYIPRGRICVCLQSDWCARQVHGSLHITIAIPTQDFTWSEGEVVVVEEDEGDDEEEENEEEEDDDDESNVWDCNMVTMVRCTKSWIRHNGGQCKQGKEDKEGRKKDAEGEECWTLMVSLRTGKAGRRRWRSLSAASPRCRSQREQERRSARQGKTGVVEVGAAAAAAAHAEEGGEQEEKAEKAAAAAAAAEGGAERGGVPGRGLEPLLTSRTLTHFFPAGHRDGGCARGVQKRQLPVLYLSPIMILIARGSRSTTCDRELP